MEFFAILIPIILSVVFIFVVKFRDGFPCSFNLKSSATISGIIVGIFLLIITVMSCVMKGENEHDVEYLSYYYTKIRHTDRWNEYIHRTCTRQVKVGEDKDGNPIYEEEEYDCSYVEEHPERWIATTNVGDEIYMNETEFNDIKSLWNVPMVFVDMHRNYHTIDGDAQDYIWNKNKNTIKTHTISHMYQNKIIGSETAFKYRDVSKDEARELGLYDYPQIKDEEQNPIIGNTKSVTKDDIRRMQYINAYYGATKQFRTFLLIFSNSSASIVDDQRCYWQGGNKNEFVTCVGVNGKTNEIEWVQCFSWLDDITMEVECRNYLMRDSILDIGHYCDWVEKNMRLWKRKEFKDFDYIDIALNSGQMISIYITMLILSTIVFGILFYMSFKEV